jgi:hypothetical protein
MVRLETEQFEEAGLGFGEVAAVGERIREAVQRFDVTGIERKCLALTGDCACESALKAKGVAEVAGVVGDAGILCDRGSDEPLSLNVVAILLRHDAEQVQCFGMIRLQLQDASVARFGRGKTAGLMVRQPAGDRVGDLARILCRSFGSKSQHHVVVRRREEQASRQTKASRRLQAAPLLRVSSLCRVLSTLQFHFGNHVRRFLTRRGPSTILAADY